MRIEGDARGMTVACAEGTVWLTQPGDTGDHILSADESFTITRRGVVMVEAWREACIVLAEDGESARPKQADTLPALHT